MLGVAYPLVPDVPQLAEFVPIQSGPAPKELRHPLLALKHRPGETLLDSTARAITLRKRFSHDITALGRTDLWPDARREMEPTSAVTPNRVVPSL
jgi:hypothetical protein